MNIRYWRAPGRRAWLRTVLSNAALLALITGLSADGKSTRRNGRSFA